jgi:glycosyltransferase involved in cell wall biosynthesis
MSRNLQIVIDIRDLRVAKTGAKTYLEEVCREFRKGRPGFTFHFADTWLPVYRGNNRLLKVIEHIRFFSWKQLCLPVICIFKKADILFCTDYFLPLVKLRYRTAVVFHDAFFWEYPGQYNALWLKLLNSIGLSAARKADAIITVSQYSKQQIILHTGIAAEKMHAIHLAPKTTGGPASGTAATIPDNDRKYILHIGVLEKRKNLPNLIKAFHMLLQKGYQDHYLVLVGSAVTKEKINDSRNILNVIRELELEERVIMPGFISDEQLAAYYRNAEVYAFVSLNEGFGLPVLEAFQHGVPALISDNTCLPEVGGDAVITCNPFSVEDICSKLKMIISNPALQKELVEKGYKRLALFSWEQTATELLHVFRSIYTGSKK